MTTKRPNIPAIRARLAAATPGPWRWNNEAGWLEGGGDFAWCLLDCSHPDDRPSPGDALLIAHAPADLEALCGEVERLEGMLFVAEKILTQRPNSELPYSHVGLLKRIAALRAAHDTSRAVPGDSKWAYGATREEGET